MNTPPLNSLWAGWQRSQVRRDALRFLAVALSAIVLTTVPTPQPAVAQSPAAKEFRIESQVYVDGSDTPASQNVTLFARGIVYDFQLPGGGSKDATEIVMFDEGKRQLILLDVARQLSWTVADIRLLKMVDQLRRETANSDKAKFLVSEPFTEDHDWSNDQVSLASESIKYIVRGKRPDDASILPRYYDFLDQFTRLAASDPQRMPPFARLSLNQTIKSMGWMPSEVKISIEANEFFKQPLKASSKHVMIMSLSDEDHERIAFARRCWAEFKNCSLVEYRGLERTATVAKKPSRRLFGGDSDSEPLLQR